MKRCASPCITVLLSKKTISSWPGETVLLLQSTYASTLDRTQLLLLNLHGFLSLSVTIQWQFGYVLIYTHTHTHRILFTKIEIFSLLEVYCQCSLGTNNFITARVILTGIA